METKEQRGNKFLIIIRAQSLEFNKSGFHHLLGKWPWAVDLMTEPESSYLLNETNDTCFTGFLWENEPSGHSTKNNTYNCSYYFSRTHRELVSKWIFFPVPSSLSYLMLPKSHVTGVLIWRFVVDLRIGEEVRARDNVEFVKPLGLSHVYPSVSYRTSEYIQNIPIRLPATNFSSEVWAVSWCGGPNHPVVVSIRTAFLSLLFQY